LTDRQIRRLLSAREPIRTGAMSCELPDTIIQLLTLYPPTTLPIRAITGLCTTQYWPVVPWSDQCIMHVRIGTFMICTVHTLAVMHV